MLADRYVKSPALCWAALLIAVVGAVLQTFVMGGFPIPYRIDLDVYRTGAQVFLDGGDLYGTLPPLLRGDDLPFTYPPIAAALFSVLAIMPLALATTVVTVGSIVALAGTMKIVVGQLTDRAQREQWWLVAAIMAVGLWFGPIWETFGFGQINIFLMALVIVDVVKGRGKWWGGTLVGLGIAIKLTPAVFLLLFFLRKDWRGGITTVISFLVYTGIGFLLSLDDSMRYWAATLSDTGRIGAPEFSSNQSIKGVLARLSIDSGLAWFLVALVVGLFIAWVAWRLIQQGQDLASAIVVGFSALLCSPVSWGHHWVWALPLLVQIVVWAARTRRRRWWILAAVGAVIFYGEPQWWFPFRYGKELDWNPLQQLIGSGYVFWSLVALAMIGAFARGLKGGSSATAEMSSASRADS